MTSAEEAASLRRRLAEAEETLRAIREGEIDALVVRRADEEQVFHLVGGGDSYRALMEAINIGAAALDETQHLLYANAALADLLGASPETLSQGAFWETLGKAAPEVRSLADSARAAKRSAEIALSLGGVQRQVVVTAAPLPLGISRGVALTFADITDRVEAAAAEESERIGRAVMASANEAVLVCDDQGIVTHASPAVAGVSESNPVGKRFEEAFPISLPPGAGAMQAEDLIAIALGGSPVRSIEATVASGGTTRELLINAAPLRRANGSVRGCIVTLVDLTERKALEKRQALLMAELDHRMKNMLALVLAISTRTLNGSSDLAQFRETFTRRIGALAMTQSLLAERSWTGVTLEDLVVSELTPFVAPNGPRVALSGLGVRISRDVAVALGLVLHELATNAVKYGALSNETGRVVLRAERLEDGSFEMAWREEGGPPVSPPTRRGFGQSVIARGLGDTHGSGASVEFRPEGLVCRIRLGAGSIA